MKLIVNFETLRRMRGNAQMMQSLQYLSVLLAVRHTTVAATATSKDVLSVLAG
jgi:hypothetical protein